MVVQILGDLEEVTGGEGLENLELFLQRELLVERDVRVLDHSLHPLLGIEKLRF